MAFIFSWLVVVSTSEIFDGLLSLLDLFRQGQTALPMNGTTPDGKSGHLMLIYPGCG